MSASNAKTSPLAPPADFSSCPDWGKGGRYVYDPATQTRTRVQDDEADAVVNTEPEAPAADAGKSKKER